VERAEDLFARTDILKVPLPYILLLLFFFCLLSLLFFLLPILASVPSAGFPQEGLASLNPLSRLLLAPPGLPPFKMGS